MKRKLKPRNLKTEKHCKHCDALFVIKNAAQLYCYKEECRLRALAGRKGAAGQSDACARFKICRECSGPLVENEKGLCGGCRITLTTYHRTRRAWAKKNGICRVCFVDPATTGVMCDYCYGEAFKRKYGITLGDFKELIVRQDGECAMKGFGPCMLDKRNRGSHLVPDHDHVTNKIRMALCSGHNHTLGKLGDNLAGVQKLLTLLTNPPAEFLYLRGCDKVRLKKSKANV
jgi:hypothetical protein